MSGSSPAKGASIVQGVWKEEAKNTRTIIDPLNGENFLEFPDTKTDAEVLEFAKSLSSCPKSGLHNPLKNVERYIMLGDVCEKASRMLGDKKVEDFFTKLIQRVVGKSDAQSRGEVIVTRKWLTAFSGDNVRNLGRSFGLPGDHIGQETRGYRFPFGPVGVITPFNFPLEIPALQTLSALFMGNRPLVKVDEKVQIVMEQFLRLLHECGLPKNDVDLLWSSGPVMMDILKKGDSRMTLFTGSQAVAELLTIELKGKVKLEDAGFDWKIFGPDVSDIDYVAWQADHDSYAYSGQKCSAQSMMFLHENWTKTDFLKKLEARASQRNLSDMTLGPIITWSTERIQKHVDEVLKIKGAKLLFGGKALKNHSIPECYGAFEATAIFVPIEEFLKDDVFELATTELFGPFQVVTEFNDSNVDLVLEACERMENHLTAAVVSNDLGFQNKILSSTVNGTTYVGIRAKTAGALQNHWFGPSNDPRAAGIHTPEAIKLVWSGHREIVHDTAATPEGWSYPPLQ
eukprot:CAMPEP_0167754318 /NCGR_PEP_ID=MMETSP0110_2-20121227/8202_1 /TAXON_ID=629695 /ORGANISM="Gymnochlora sp., Strain CCMP2014" /LENGTH=513 /DNA_ID=CAMNT_0007640181 /DNA_START=136 /DNA_END=1677 /DNA_ORIENTATION=-